MRCLFHILLVLLLGCLPQTAVCQSMPTTSHPLSSRHLDHIMARVRERVLEVSHIYPDYEAGVYIQGSVDVLKRGPLLKQIPYLKSLRKGVDNYQAEFIGEVTFTNPNIYNKSLFPLSSGQGKFMEGHIETVAQPLTQLNVYSQYLFYNLYSPFAHKSYKYYNFKVLNLWQRGDETYFKISFTPKFSNFKFVEGDFVVSSGSWNIREIAFRGAMELIKFSIHVVMGNDESPDSLLPRSIQAETQASLLGTRLKGSYRVAFRYDSVRESHLLSRVGEGAEKYNLSSIYKTNPDTLQSLVSSIREYRDSILTDSVQRAKGEPGTPQQESPAGSKQLAVTRSQAGTQQTEPAAGSKQSAILAASPSSGNLDTLLLQLDTLHTSRSRKGTLARMGNFFMSDYSVDIKNVGELDFLPLVSPILFDFSTSNGISYTQKLKFTRITSREKLFYLEPRIGYNFKYKELYWGVKGEVNYAPSKMSRIFIDIGNGNKVTTNKIRDELFSLPLPIYDSTKINLKDFKTSYARIGHKIEVANGLTLSTNLAFMRYSENGYSDFTPIYPDNQFSQKALKIASHQYITFVPELELTYTPHQYYYMNGERKTYLYSRYPTFSLSLAHAIKGVFHSTTRYNKAEFDMHQRLKIGPMHEFFFRVGAGLFYDYTDLYFAEFKNLRRNNLPEGWNDDIGGTFHLLPRIRYSEIDKYLRANVKYDAPMLLSSSLLRSVKYITKERLYCNLLLVDTMDPYIEMGYGIGTHIFNVGVFWGGEITRWNHVGVKFTFEIFND